MHGIPRLLLPFALLLATASPAGAEAIRRFESRIDLVPDGSYVVSERIVYDFEGQLRHGIYRDIPVRYERSGADFRLGVDLLEVTDENQVPREVRESREGPYLRIRIGDPDRKITGVQEYRIRYAVHRGVLFFEDHDEIYWNATGTEWAVPIDLAQLDVSLPPERASLSLRLACFTGAMGSRETDCASEATATGAHFVATRALRRREGLTAVVGLPKGIVPEPTAFERLRARLGDYVSAGLLLPFVVGGVLFGLWRRHGRDPGARESIAVRYEPPEGLTPAEVGTLLDESADLDDITSSILDLAVRGHLRIRETESSRFLFFSTKDYELTKLGSPTDLRPHEAKLLAGLFRSGDRVAISELRNKFYEKLPGIRKALYKELSGPRRHFPTSPDRVRTWWMLAGGVSIALGVMGAGMGLASFPTALGVGATGALVIAFGRVMPRKTRRGRRAYEEILGFREFLERVDKDRLERLGTRTAETFERWLPYAVVLGVADAWADAFADIYTEPPSWYVCDGARGRFVPRDFVGDVGQSLKTMGQTLSSSPSRGSGGSGFGGGGTSGGGFGGGGGGSW